MTRPDRLPQSLEQKTAHKAPVAQVRLLATTDLHLQLRGFDYVSDGHTSAQGLAGIGTLIDAARAEAAAQNRACLLFDNGDLLQGTPMGGWLAPKPVGPDHPVVNCINLLGYDALGVGNHDLDFGLPYLNDVARRCAMPMVASNLSSADTGLLQKSAMLSCPLPATSADGGATQALKIGVLSVLPSQTAVWNEHWLDGQTPIQGAMPCLEAKVPALRAAGADLVVVLAHMGIGSQDETADETALEMARVHGIDALITGHTHRRFPGRDHRRQDGIAPAKGTLLEVPTIMPGHGGSDLGVLDLTLRKGPDGAWRVIGSVSSLRRNDPKVRLHAGVIAATQPAHKALRDHLSVPIGVTDRARHNYFSLAAPTQIGALNARAIALTVTPALPDHTLHMPLLVAASAHTTGGREGPDHYLHIPAGDVQRRHLAGLNPYNNQIWVIEIAGAALLRRLEHAAAVFTQLTAGGPLVPLLRPEVPGFNFETIYGINYQIDPRQSRGQRISNLTHEGRAVQADDRFLLATDQFRAAGGAGFERIGAGNVVLRLPETSEAAFATALSLPAEKTLPWTFAACGGLTAELATSPQARDCLSQISHLAPVPLALNRSGFLRVKITL